MFNDVEELNIVFLGIFDDFFVWLFCLFFILFRVLYVEYYSYCCIYFFLYNKVFVIVLCLCGLYERSLE